MIIMPVENQVRELDAKLLLACVAAERGLPVMLGSAHHIDLAMPHLPRGLFLAMNMRPPSRRMLRIIRGLGHDIVAWDEESLVRFRSPEYYRWRYSAGAFEVIGRLFAWGPDDAEFFAGYTGYRGAPIHPTGNPRIDLLRAELRGYFSAEVSALKRRYGDFILVNTNFSFVNNFDPTLNLIQRDAAGRPQVGRSGRGMSQSFALGLEAHQLTIFEQFRKFMPRLALRFPRHRIVLRPHPSEDHDAWRHALKGCPQIEIVHQGNVVPWLLAAQTLLHNGCTTAVEASVLETPAVAFMPVTSETYDYHLPNGLSHRARTPEQALQMVSEVVLGHRSLVDHKVRKRLLNRHLAPLDDLLTCDRVLDVLLPDGSRNLGRPPAKASRIMARTHCHLRALEKRVKSIWSGRGNEEAHHSHRFPGVPVSELNQRIARFGALLNRFGTVRADPHLQHVFRIHDPQAGHSRCGASCSPLLQSLEHERGGVKMY